MEKRIKFILNLYVYINNYRENAIDRNNNTTECTEYTLKGKQKYIFFRNGLLLL